MNAMKISLTDLPNHLELPLDVFICSASFEDRCKSAAEKIDPSRVTRVLVCEYQDFESVATEAANAAWLRSRFANKVRRVILSTNKPLLTADNLSNALDDLPKAQCLNMMIDISTFTHEALLILLKLLRQSGLSAKIKFVYTGAREYSIGLQGNEKWLSKGIDDVRSVLGYPGELAPSKKLHLIILAGFESERAEKLIEAYEPAVVSLGLGEREASISEDHHDLNSVFHQRVVDFCTSISARSAGIRNFEFSCIDPIEAKVAIERQIAEYPGYNVIIAPLNTKISTVGAALAALERPSIQLCYSHPLQYNISGYSSPDENCRLFDLPDFLTKE